MVFLTQIRRADDSSNSICAGNTVQKGKGLKNEWSDPGSSLTCQLLSEQLLLGTRPLPLNMAGRDPWRFPAAYAYPKLKRPAP